MAEIWSAIDPPIPYYYNIVKLLILHLLILLNPRLIAFMWPVQVL